jgi:hypothetical protein
MTDHAASNSRWAMSGLPEAGSFFPVSTLFSNFLGLFFRTLPSLGSDGIMLTTILGVRERNVRSG